MLPDYRCAVRSAFFAAGGTGFFGLGDTP